MAQPAFSTEEPARIALWPKTVKGVATPRVSLDGTWKFTLNPPDEPFRNDVDCASWSDVQVPGELALQGFDIENDRAYPYKRVFVVPPDYVECQVILRFESVHSDATVWVNGIQVGRHCGPATAWDCDITAAVVPGAEANLTVRFEDRIGDPSILSRYARHATGGILRSVTLMAQPRIHLSRLHIDATLSPDNRTGVLNLDAAVSNPGGRPIALLLELTAPDGRTAVLSGERLDLTPGSGTLSLPAREIEAWDAEHPRLYTLSCRLMAGDAFLEELEERVGFRRITFGGKDGSDPRKVYVNGQPVKLRGVNLHDFSWDKGRVTSSPINQQDVAQLKACNVNYLRTSHYSPPKALVDACDRWGIYLEVETAICFQHGILDQEQIARYLSRFVEMVEAHRNHPSVLIWSLGNESSWNEGISAEYDWIKANDRTRPVKFSWPQTIFEEHAPMDLFSIHYIHFMDGFNATHDIEAENVPALHDEIAHVPCNDLVELRRDPNVHNFWGESIKRRWDEIYAAEGALGCAIWEAKDDVFCLPHAITHKQETIHNDVNGMGGWGCIWDGVGKLKPEAWLVKKAYSPIRIDQRAFALPDESGTADIRVSNRFSHTKLSELNVEWVAHNDTGSIILPAIPPGQSGSFSIPARRWQRGEELVLSFYTPDGVMVDEHRLMAGQPERTDVSISGPAPEVQEEHDAVTLTAADVRLTVDRRTGKIRKLLWRDQTLIGGGPYLHLTGMNPGPWKSDEGGVLIERREHESTVTVVGAYGALRTAFRVSLAGNGVLTAAYELRSEPEDQRELSEVGLSFDLPDSADRIQWQRQGLWTAYPQDHIGRNRGIACRVRAGAAGQPDRIGMPQPWPWKDNMRDFSLYKRADPQDGHATHDFRSMKEHVLDYSVSFSDSDTSLQIIPLGDAACRMSYEPFRDPLVHVSDADVAFAGPWERVPLVGYNGAVWVTRQAGASATVDFEGSGVRIFGLRQAEAALMRVLVDGAPRAMVDPSRGSVGAQSSVEMLYEVADLPEGPHTVKVTAADSHGGALGINVFEVLHHAPAPARARLIVNQLWNYPQLDWGNLVKPAIRLQKGLTGTLHLRVISDGSRDPRA
jgi:hypothetical protein